MDIITDLDHIPVSVLRQALTDSGYAVTRASIELGWGKDASKLRRALGYKPNRGRYATHVDYDLAVKMIRGWCLDPVDYGV